jgi:hypothetical protein
LALARQATPSIDFVGSRWAQPGRVEQAGVPQAVEEDPAAGREVGVHRVPAPVQREPLDDPGRPQAVVAVEVVMQIVVIADAATPARVSCR